jgi:pyridoxal phosphate enzyme (YggS family)
VIRAAHAAGQRHFAENYLQEALDKIEALADLDIVWHFIGPIQSNKTRPIAERFDWVHSVDRVRIAQRLSDQRPAGLPPVQICLQVNVSGEASKSGVEPGEVQELAAAIGDLPGVQLRGLMTIPEPSDDPALQRLRFSTLRALLPSGRSHGRVPDTLSMGMSDDLEAAIAEGATMVRVGRAIFGDRSA